MNFRECMQAGRDVLMEGALGERLRRRENFPFLFSGNLVEWAQKEAEALI